VRRLETCVAFDDEPERRAHGDDLGQAYMPKFRPTEARATKGKCCVMVLVDFGREPCRPGDPIEQLGCPHRIGFGLTVTLGSTVVDRIGAEREAKLGTDVRFRVKALRLRLAVSRQ
jgi:hypothetical protein